MLPSLFLLALYAIFMLLHNRSRQITLSRHLKAFYRRVKPHLYHKKVEGSNKPLLVLAQKMVIDHQPLLQLIVQKLHHLRLVNLQIILWLVVIQMVVVMMVMIRKMKTQIKSKILFLEVDNNRPNRSKAVTINYQKMLKIGAIKSYLIKQLLLLELLHLDFLCQVYILHLYSRNLFLFKSYNLNDRTIIYQTLKTK